MLQSLPAARSAAGKVLAFHGTHLENVHSILHLGLLNLSGTRLQRTGGQLARASICLVAAGMVKGHAAGGQKKRWPGLYRATSISFGYGSCVCVWADCRHGQPHSLLQSAPSMLIPGQILLLGRFSWDVPTIQHTVLSRQVRVRNYAWKHGQSVACAQVPCLGRGSTSPQSSQWRLPSASRGTRGGPAPWAAASAACLCAA